jgi:lysophospholipase L1-like esterase
VDAVVRDVAAARGLAYVDIAGSTGAAFRADPDRYLAADRYHPDDAGYGLWCEAVAPVVADVLAHR